MGSKGISIEKILDICEKIIYFLGVNFLFLLSNIPVLLFFLFVGISQVRTCLPLFLLSMVPFGPALSAVFFCMNRLLAGHETGVWRDYKKGCLSDLGQKLALCAGQLLVLWILWTNVEFFAVQVPILPLMVLFVILFAAVLLMTPNLYLLAARYKMNNRQIIKDALILLVTRPGVLLGDVAALAVILMFLEIQAGTTVLFMGSVYGFLVVFMHRHIFYRLEESQ